MCSLGNFEKERCHWFPLKSSPAKLRPKPEEKKAGTVLMLMDRGYCDTKRMNRCPSTQKPRNREMGWHDLVSMSLSTFFWKVSLPFTYLIAGMESIATSLSLAEFLCADVLSGPNLVWFSSPSCNVPVNCGSSYPFRNWKRNTFEATKLVGGFNPSEKYESQLGWWNSQPMEK